MSIYFAIWSSVPEREKVRVVTSERLRSGGSESIMQDQLSGVGCVPFQLVSISPKMITKHVVRILIEFISRHMQIEGRSVERHGWGSGRSGLRSLTIILMSCSHEGKHEGTAFMRG